MVGSAPQLGDWDCDKAPAMKWSEGDQWLLSLDLPAGSHEFKLVAVAPPAGEGAGLYANWEAGPNRTLKVPAVEASTHGAFTVVCEWGNTASSMETLPSEELEGEEPLSESEEPALRPEDLGAEPYSPNGDEGEAPVGVVGKMTIERAEEPQEPAATTATKHEAGQMGKRPDDTTSGVPAGGLKPSTEAAVKQELRKADFRKPGLLARFVQALTGSLLSEDEDEDKGSRGPPGGGGSSTSSGAKGAEGGSQAQQQRGEQGPPASSAAAVMQDPPSGMQLAIAAAGLAALPVVAWSEWVLKSTGCGLPPGPSGLLGAAEGLSYLVVGSVVLWSLASKLSTGRGLPAGPGGALGAVEGGSWLAALSGLVVLALQWQTYGYIPSALPDSNCFGQPSSLATAQAPGAPSAAASMAAAPPVSAIDSSKAPAAYGGPMRLAAGRSTSLPQGNLLFSLETALSQGGGIVQGAETAAAAMAAAAAGQPPPAQVAAAMQELKSRAMQAQQLVAALSSRAVGLGGEAGTDSALQAAAAAGTAAAAHEAPAPAEPLRFQPPRHRVRAALTASVDKMLHSEKLRAVLEPVPLPAVARQAAEAAGGALSAVDAAAKEAVEQSFEAVQREEQLAAAWGKRAVGGAISKAQSDAEQLSGAAADAQSRLLSWLPQLRSAEQHEEQQPAAAAAMVAATPSRPSSSGKVAAEAAKPGSKVAAAAARPDERGGSVGKKISGDVSSIFGSVVSDLKEGYVGLWHSAQHFDAHQAMANLNERLAEGQAAQARAHAAAEAAANGGKAAGEGAKASAAK